VLRLLSVWIRSGFDKNVWPLLFDFAARPPHVFVLVLHGLRLPLHAFALVLPFHRLLFDFAARPPHVFVLVLHAFAPALLAHLLLEAVTQDAQTLIPALRTFCRSRADIELNETTIFGIRIHWARLFRYCQGNGDGRTCSRVTCVSLKS
jgi:hypothetical protein